MAHMMMMMMKKMLPPLSVSVPFLCFFGLLHLHISLSCMYTLALWYSNKDILSVESQKGIIAKEILYKSYLSYIFYGLILVLQPFSLNPSPRYSVAKNCTNKKFVRKWNEKQIIEKLCQVSAWICLNCNIDVYSFSICSKTKKTLQFKTNVRLFLTKYSIIMIFGRLKMMGTPGYLVQFGGLSLLIFMSEGNSWVNFLKFGGAEF